MSYNMQKLCDDMASAIQHWSSTNLKNDLPNIHDLWKSHENKSYQFLLFLHPNKTSIITINSAFSWMYNTSWNVVGIKHA